MRYMLAAALVMAGLAVCANAAPPVILTYQADNRWVAADHNAPLRKLMKAARNGSSTFVFRLPSTDRRLNEERVEVLRGLLQREAEKQKAYKGLMMEEGEGTAPDANTLWVQPIN